MDFQHCEGPLWLRAHPFYGYDRPGVGLLNLHDTGEAMLPMGNLDANALGAQPGKHRAFEIFRPVVL
jgi:hypothetical protein